MRDENLEKLFAAARRSGAEGTPSIPAGFVESILGQYRNRVQEKKVFFKASILSIATAFIILGMVLGVNFERNGSSGSDDQESTVEMAYALWDPAGN